MSEDEARKEGKGKGCDSCKKGNGCMGFLINFYDYIIHKLFVIIIFIKKYINYV